LKVRFDEPEKNRNRTRLNRGPVFFSVAVALSLVQGRLRFDRLYIYFKPTKVGLNRLQPVYLHSIYINIITKYNNYNNRVSPGEKELREQVFIYTVGAHGPFGHACMPKRKVAPLVDIPMTAKPNNATVTSLLCPHPPRPTTKHRQLQSNQHEASPDDAQLASSGPWYVSLLMIPCASYQLTI
jgi:hypothetical protein